jgi:hypothetical protein
VGLRAVIPGGRYGRPVALGLGAALVVLAGVAAYARTPDVLHTALATLAAVIAVGVAGLAVSLPGITRRGAVIGGFFVTAGIFTWTFTSRPLVIWAVLAAQGVVAMVWAWPWLAGLRALPRLGTAWVGLAYWVFGVIGAVLVGHLGVAVQRLAYGGVFGLCALALVAAVRRPPPGGGRLPDPSVGIAAAILVGIAALLLVGSGTVFATVHDVPGFAASNVMRGRFWGGPGLYFHPNSMAGLVVVAAARIGPDRAFAAWQRLAVTVLAGFLLFLTNSRIAFVFAVAAAGVHALLLLRRRYHADLPSYRRVWLAALVPFAVLGLVLALSGGQKFLSQSRFQASSGNDVTSGRLDTWGQVGRDWERAGWAEKLFGDAGTSRAVVVRDVDKPGPDGKRPQLNTDNAAVGAFRRGGVLGALAFLAGLVLLLRTLLLRTVLLPGRGPARGTAQAWLIVAVLGALPTIATEDWWLGGTNGGLWILLLAGEAYLLWAVSGTPSARPVAGSASERSPEGGGSAGSGSAGSAATATPASSPSRR